MAKGKGSTKHPRGTKSSVGKEIKSKSKGGAYRFNPRAGYNVSMQMYSGLPSSASLSGNPPP